MKGAETNTKDVRPFLYKAPGNPEKKGRLPAFISASHENWRKIYFRSSAAGRKWGRYLGSVGPGFTIRAWMKYHVWPKGMASKCGWGGGSVVPSSTHGGGVLRGRREDFGWQRRMRDVPHPQPTSEQRHRVERSRRSNAQKRTGHAASRK